MGEPLLNCEATVGALRILMDPEGFAVAPRRLNTDQGHRLLEEWNLPEVYRVIVLSATAKAHQLGATEVVLAELESRSRTLLRRPPEAAYAYFFLPGAADGPARAVREESMRYEKSPLAIVGGALLAAGLSFAPAASAQESTEELAKAAQNPVAAMISLPFQNNTNFGYGPDNDIQNILNIQPVWPFSLGANWNLITRTILPVIYQPDLTLPVRVAPGVVQDVTIDGAFGLGDLFPTFFFSPAKASKVLWGIGPTFTLPIATDDILGSGKWSAGPALVVLTMPGHWVLGVLVNNQWSFAGSSNRADVNAMVLQYFVNYNLAKGWYITSAPLNTANWEADSSDRWTVPIGGGVGRIFRAGKQPMNVSVSAFYNVVKPDNLPAADWQLRFQVQLLFPKS